VNAPLERTEIFLSGRNTRFGSIFARSLKPQQEQAQVSDVAEVFSGEINCSNFSWGSSPPLVALWTDIFLEFFFVNADINVNIMIFRLREGEKTRELKVEPVSFILSIDTRLSELEREGAVAVSRWARRNVFWLRKPLDECVGPPPS